MRVDGGEGRRQGVQRMALEGSERVDIGGGSWDMGCGFVEVLNPDLQKGPFVRIGLLQMVQVYRWKRKAC